MEIIGLDLHKRETQLSIKADDGSITDRRIATNRERFTGHVRQATAHPHPARGEHGERQREGRPPTGLRGARREVWQLRQKYRHLRERQQILVRAGVAADAREAVLQHPAGEELVGHLRHNGTPRAVVPRKAAVIDRLQSVQVIRHQAKERRLLASGSVDVARHRGRVWHARSGTEERRHTPDSSADRHRSVARRAILTQRPRMADLTKRCLLLTSGPTISETRSIGRSAHNRSQR